MAKRGDSCVKRDVCVYYGCGSTSDLCADCGHYLAEAVKTPTNSAMAKLLERWLYPEQRGDIMDLTHETKLALEQLRQ